MLDSLSAEMKKLLLAGIGAAAVTAEKSKQVIDELVQKGDLTLQQGKVLNEELKHTIRGKKPPDCSTQNAKEAFSMQSLLEQIKQLDPQQLKELKLQIEQQIEAEGDEYKRDKKQ